MRSNAFKEARLGLLILSLLLVVLLLFYFFASMFTSMGYSGFRLAKNASYVDEELVIIIDPGHGGEDPGAVANGMIEKSLNLSLANSLNQFLLVNGYKTVMTRNDDVLLYNSGEENKKKYYDLRNREAIAKEYANSIFVSIHMNKFPISSCKGLQTFYSSNNDSSIELAKSIQSNSRILQIDNKREVKEGSESIYLLKNLNMPTVLVECGFISNETEAEMLTSHEYKTALALTIYCGIAEHLEGLN